MKCPGCDLPLSLSRVVMDQELVTFSMEWEGAMVEAKTIGGVIAQTGKLLAAAAKETGIPSDVYMHSIEWAEKSAKFHFLVIPRNPASPAITEGESTNDWLGRRHNGAMNEIPRTD